MADSRKQENLAAKTKDNFSCVGWATKWVSAIARSLLLYSPQETDTHRFALIHGDVKQHIDKEAGRRVFRVSGSVPAANYLQLPRTVNQSLGLTGRYMYLGLRPTEKVYVLHIDIGTQQGHTIRLSFSNLYKTAKIGSRMIRFPGQLKADSWVLFCVDLVAVLDHAHEQHTYSHIKCVQICANMSVRSIFTTDTRFTEETLPRDIWPIPQKSKGPCQFEWFWVPEDVKLTLPEDDEKDVTALAAGKKRIAAKRRKKPAQGVEVVKHGWEAELETLVLSPNKRTITSPVPLKAGQPSEPDAIMTLKSAIGFTGGIGSGALWLDDQHVVYPAGTVVVILSLDTGFQRVLFGHTETISAMVLSQAGRYLATAQAGKDSLVRIWDFGDWEHGGAVPTDDQIELSDPAATSQSSIECVSVITGPITDIYALAWSMDETSDNLITAVGRDHRGRFALSVWNTGPLERGGRAKLISTRSHDYDTRAISFSPSRERLIVTCGHNNVRMWRLRGGELRTATLELGEHQNHDFNALAFEPFPSTNMLVSTSDGKIFQIDYKSRALRYIYQLHDSSIAALAVTKEFCVTGAEDGLLRLWRPDFSHSFLEIQHDGPVRSAYILGKVKEDEDEKDVDGKILVGAVPGAIGYLSINTHTYQNVVRAHGGPVLGLAIHTTEPEFATVSEDGTARVWSRETCAQLYEFEAPGECAHAVSYHPTDHLLACGFGSGIVRVFDIETTKCLHETPTLHTGPVLALSYDHNGQRLFSAGADGRLVVMDVENGYDASLVQTMLAPQLPSDLVPPEIHDARTLNASPRKAATMHAAIEAARATGQLQHNGFCQKCLAGDAHVTICFNEDGSLMAVSGAGSGHITVLSASSLDLIQAVNTGSTAVAATVFSGDDVLATTKESSILHCDPFSGKVRRGHAGPRGLVEIPEMSMALDVSPGGAHAVTGGSDGLLRVHAADVVHSPTTEGHGQFFLGHGHELTCLKFLADGMGVISADRGGSIIIWDFLGVQVGGLSPLVEMLPDEAIAVAEEIAAAEEDEFVLIEQKEGEEEEIREAVPKPYINNDDADEEVSNVMASSPVTALPVPPTAPLLTVENGDDTRSASVRVERGSEVGTVDTGDAGEDGVSEQSDTGKAEIPDLPNIHYTPRPAAPMADTRYAPSPRDAGLQLQYLLGYSGRAGHDNVIWHPDTGLFVYSAAGSLVVEDLATRAQRHLLGHTSDVSCLAISIDGQFIASASGTADTAQVANRTDGTAQKPIGRLTIINIWDSFTGQCMHSLAGHSGGGVQAMAFSPDGQYLASIGTATDCTLAIWRISGDEGAGSLVATAELPTPAHRVAWDPHSPRELVTVGRGDRAGDGRRNAVLFWLVEEDGHQLKFQEADHCRPANPTPEGSPGDMEEEKDGDSLGQSLRAKSVDHTAVLFSTSAEDRVMYVGDVDGRIGVWDTVENRFLVQWIAHSRPAEGNRGYHACEIDVIALSSDGRKMVTAGSSGEVKLWSIDIQSHTGTLVNSVDLSQASATRSGSYNEDQRVPGVSAACFDDTCTHGVVGSYAGHIYFVSFDPRSTNPLVRLAGAHAAGSPVLCLGCDSEGRLLGTGGSDGSLRLWTMPSALGDSTGMEVEGWYSEAGAYSARSDASCMAVTFHPTARTCLAGFGDGSLLAVDLAQSRVVATLKLAEDRYATSPTTPWQTEAAAITHCVFVTDEIALAGTRSGLVFVVGGQGNDWSAPRVLGIDESHRGHAIDSLDVSMTNSDLVLTCDGAANITILKVVASSDGVELDLVYKDHLEFGDNIEESTASESALPCLVKFHPRDPSVLLVTGFGPEPSHLLYYNYQTRSVLRAVPLMHSLLCMSMAPSGYYLAMGTTDRLVKLVDVDEDFIGHSDAVDAVWFAPSSRYAEQASMTNFRRHLYSAGRDGAILCWNARS